MQFLYKNAGGGKKVKQIVMITNGAFPEGEPGALRIKYIAKALTANGCKVTVLCRGNSKESGEIEDIQYYSYRNARARRLKKVSDYFSFPSHVKEYLKVNGPVDAVYVYNAHMSIFAWLKKYAKKNPIPLLHDCVEWYSPEEFKYGRFDLSYIIKNLINTKIIDRQYRIIAISEYLSDYYSGKGIDTMRIPMLCDMSGIQINKCIDKETTQLFYAGNPGGKDLVGNVIKALTLLSDEDKSKVRFTLIGCTKEHLINVCGVRKEDIEQAGDIIDICGRIPRSEVLSRMSSANFVVLSRDASLRYAQAGFPSKIVEALSNSTPVLCNLSSDLGDYLIDNENAVLAKDHTPESLAEAIHRAAELSYDQKNEMCAHARRTAEKYFDWKEYSSDIAKFFELE